MDIEDGLTMGWYSFSYIIKYLDKYLQEKTSNQDYSIFAELGIDFEQKKLISLIRNDVCVIFALR